MCVLEFDPGPVAKVISFTCSCSYTAAFQDLHACMHYNIESVKDGNGFDVCMYIFSRPDILCVHVKNVWPARLVCK